MKRIVANASIQASIASQRAASLAGSVAQTQGKLASDNEASVRLAELERNAESSRTLYQAFLDRYRQTVAQSGLESSDSYIVSRARVPGPPSRSEERRVGKEGVGTFRSRLSADH